MVYQGAFGNLRGRKGDYRSSVTEYGRDRQKDGRKGR